MLKGKGISEGIGIGKALVLKKEKIKIEKRRIEEQVIDEYSHSFLEIEGKKEQRSEKQSC